ncbi:FecCD family ABC transporter permease [Virgibacillus halophilus]|uniref:Iron ABC transporter permease n=1 Tax=Tigheibacillus halophilus TaxID=361280 RepID=A0ABU5C7I7_9BACI|nr:iron ABC transporter permease [Virgibacillus halophilus]
MFKLEKTRFAVLFGLGMIVCAILSYTSLVTGTYAMSFTEVWQTLFRIDPQPELDLVILEFRLPRIIVGALVGLGLAVAGTVIQSVSKNGLADPSIIGINAGAGLAIVVFMYFFLGNLQTDSLLATFSMPIFGFIGGTLASLLIFILSWERGRLDPQRLLLIGIAISTGLSSVSLFLSLKMSSSDFDLATVWVTGSIWHANWYYLVAMLPWFVFFLPVIIYKAHVLDVFQLQEESVKGLGVQTEKQKIVLLLSSVGLVAACVSVSGTISFVGLISPHIARRLVGSKHRYILPLSGVIGMILVVFADLLAKTIVQPAEIPAGIIVAIIGVPYFVYLLFKAKV